MSRADPSPVTRCPGCGQWAHRTHPSCTACGTPLNATPTATRYNTPRTA